MLAEMSIPTFIHGWPAYFRQQATEGPQGHQPTTEDPDRMRAILDRAFGG